MEVLTLTMNPALDKSTSAEHIVVEKKLRCKTPSFEPGGGGINVSRALKKLECESTACYFSGGYTGELMQKLLEEENITQKTLEMQNWVRESYTVLDTSRNDQYRFVMPGPEIQEKEWKKALETVEQADPAPEILVASGSLPSGVPEDFHARLAEVTNKRNIKFILDVSGPPLKKALENKVFLIKPNLNELIDLSGRESLEVGEQEEIVMEIINEKKCEVIVVSLGARGAMMATKEGVTYEVPPTVPQKSAVGAGDSMVAGMVFSLTESDDLKRMLRFGIAAGTAATMTPGSELCRKSDTLKVFKWLENEGETI